MPLHPKVQALLTAQRLSGAPPMHTLTPERARADLRAQVPAVSGPSPSVARVDDRDGAGRGGRRCRCGSTRRPAAVPFPGIVYFHGGGFVIGDLETHDPLCRQIAARTGAVVCAVDYRLAPEHPFPAAADDALAAARWFMAHADELGVDRAAPVRHGRQRRRHAGDGDGAGPARSARAPSLRGQILVYPITDHVDAGAASYTEFAEGYGLTRDGMRWFMRHYIADPADATDTRVCPVRMPTLRRPAADLRRDRRVRRAARRGRALRRAAARGRRRRDLRARRGPAPRVHPPVRDPRGAGAVDRSHRGVDASHLSAG